MRLRSWISACLFASVWLSACGGGDQCSSGMTDSCCCFEFVAAEDVGPGEMGNNCAAEPTCGQLRGECPDNNPHAQCVPSSVEALDCILTALQDDAPGKVEWVTQPVPPEGSDAFGLDEKTVTLYTSGTGSVFSTGSRTTGLTFRHDSAVRRELADLDLAGCAAIAEAGPRFDCLRALFDGTGTEECVDPYPDMGP
jgi:hypothetical protein